MTCPSCSSLRKVFETFQDGLVLYDLDGRILELNPRAREMLGVQRPGDSPRQIHDLESSADRYAFRNILDQIAKEGGARSQAQIRTASSNILRVEIVGNRVDLEEGSAGLLLLHDISGRTDLEEQLIKTQRMEGIGRLAGGIAHDFNNFLLLVEGHCWLLGERLAGDPESRQMVSLIREAGQHAAELTHALLAFSRQQLLKPETVNVSELAGHLGTMLASVLGERVHVDLALADDVWPVIADPHRLEQTLVNLAMNAKDAMPAGGVLRIETHNSVARRSDPDRPALLTPGEYVCIRFVDTGCGIPADILPRIFEPFFTTKERGRGTGLGLATTYGIIKQSGGFIFADSAAGRGATFAIYLPRAAQADPVAETRPLLGPTAKAQGTVLVVEDDSRIRALIRQILEPSGYSVLTAGSGQEALSLLAETGQVDLVLADIVMPGMSLHELLEQLRTRRPQLAVALMSGYSTEVLRGPVSADYLPLLEKPFTQEQLLDRVQQALERGKAPQAGLASARA